MLFELLDRFTCWWMDWRTDRAVKALPPEMRELKLHRAEAGKNGWNIVMFAPGIVALADQAADLLDAENAKNYVQFDMMPRLDRSTRPIRVTVQWARGESPATKAARLEDELAKLKVALQLRTEEHNDQEQAANAD